MPLQTALTDFTTSKTEFRIFIQEIVARLPVEHRSTLNFLLAFLLEVSRHATENKMTTNNLAIVFGPTLMRPREEVCLLCQLSFVVLSFGQRFNFLACLSRDFFKIYFSIFSADSGSWIGLEAH